jgi:hypothetical protein
MENPLAIDSKTVDQYQQRLQGALLVGLDWDLAVVAINIPTAIIEILEIDEQIIATRRQLKAMLELELLELHRTARKIAASKGQGRPIEWMLEQVHPEKYGRQSNNAPMNPTLVKDDL